MNFSFSSSDNVGVSNDLFLSASLSNLSADFPYKIGDDFMNVAIYFGFENYFAKI